ncbi:MAG: hypothetical protein NWE92_07225 [Candidatus Bathyarchaeota archaeon]|nr:hypothetical protein [Candidatus Bathyarchaeota archaeon]
MKNSVCLALILLVVLASSFPLVSAPDSGQTVVPTSISIALKPNPVGVGQWVAFEFQVTPAPPTSNDRFVNLSAGTNLGWNYPVSTNATGGATLFYAFYPAGNRTFFVEFPGQSFENGQVYAPSRSEMTLFIQAEPVDYPIANPTQNPAHTNPPPPIWPIWPEFTATFKRASYDIVNYTTGETQQVDNSTIEFKITNQPLTGSLTSIYYLLRMAEPDYTCDYYTDSTCKRQSNTTYTILTFPLYDLLPSHLRNATSLKFQIQADTNLGKSEWSPIQTVYLTETPSPPPTAPVAMPPSATPTPSPRPTPRPVLTPPPRIETNSSGSIVRMSLAGNVTPAQFSDIILTSESAQAAQLSFVLSGQAGNTGFGNITVPKIAVPNASSIEVLIDGQPAQNQGYSQNANCYYVWFTTHFSSHQVSIVFSLNALPNVTATPNSSPVQINLIQILLGVAVAVVVIGIIIGGLLALNRERRQKPTNA